MNFLYKIISLLILLLISVFAVAIAIVNSDLVVFHFYFDEIKVSLSLLLVFAFIAGVIMAFLLILPTLIHLKFLSAKNKKLQSKMSSYQLQLSDLKK